LNNVIQNWGVRNEHRHRPTSPVDRLAYLLDRAIFVVGESANRDYLILSLAPFWGVIQHCSCAEG
jgi:hypothetical protein